VQSSKFVFSAQISRMLRKPVLARMALGASNRAEFVQTGNLMGAFFELLWQRGGYRHGYDHTSILVRD
jgi:hypothetical protein